MGKHIVDVSYGPERQVGASAYEIVAARSRGTSALHDPVVCGGNSAADWAKYKDTLTAAKTSKAAFVAEMSSAWGASVAAEIGEWTTAQQDELVKLAVDLAGIYGV